MKELENFCVSMTMNIVEYGLFYLFLLQSLPKIFLKKRANKVVAFCLVVIMTYGLDKMIDNILVKVICYIILFLLSTGLYCKKEWIKRVSYSIVFMSLTLVIDMLVVNSYMYIIGNDLSKMANGITNIVLAFISKGLLFAFVLFYRRINRMDDSRFIKKINFLSRFLVFVGFICCIGFAGLNLQLMTSTNLKIRGYFIFSCLGVIGLNVVMYFVIIGMVIYLKQREEYLAMRYQNQFLVQSSLEYENTRQEIRKAVHDFNNHLSCIDMLLQMHEVERARAYIKDYNHKCQGKFEGLETGNNIADAVLNQKYTLAKKEQVQFIYEGELTEELLISQIDLCALLGNSLDNALEACVKIENVEERFVKIFMNQHDEYLCVKIINSVKEDIDKHTKLETTKEDKDNHGIGLQSLRAIAEKYDGDMHWNCIDKQFCLMIKIKAFANIA